ncbi:unnamed protein product [Parnassius apollo]|uniref:(apollo) hypothetical protein n=1 Tax=Parnassius apollo TaxID=110799 RepID=A0A8S3XXQ7_PARAO|nr:unnamed protein product [Parnassius apollo]
MARNKRPKTAEEIRKQKRECERRRRARIKADPDLYEASKKIDNQRYAEKRRKKQVKLVSEMTPRERRAKQREWRERKARSRQNKKRDYYKICERILRIPLLMTKTWRALIFNKMRLPFLNLCLLLLQFPEGRLLVLDRRSPEKNVTHLLIALI